MRFKKRSVGGILCTSLLCSALISYVPIAGVSAEEMVFEFPFEEVSNIVDTDSVGEIPVIAMSDETDYFYLDRTQGLIAKKTGYYSSIFVSMGETLETKKMYEFTEGEALSVVTINPLYNQYVAYSEDGKTITRVFEVQPLGEELHSEIEPTLQVQSTLVETTDKTAVFNFKASVPEDVYIFIFSIYKDDGNGEWVAYDSLESELPNKAGVGLDYNYTFRENGTFYVKIRSSGENESTTTVNVGCINTEVVSDDQFVDNEPPVLTVTTEDVTGLSTLTPYNIHVTSNEICDICIDGTYTYNTQEANTSVLTNGVYEIRAIDSNGNVTEQSVTVTAFEDGVTPENYTPPNKVNMNPLSDKNKDSFWEDAKNGIFDGSGSIDLLDGVLDDSDTDTSKKSGSRLSRLPQTGTPAWFAIVGGTIAVLIAGGIFAMKKSGLLKKRRNKNRGGSENE